MRIPLTISTDYVPSWGVVEGLRELISNWLDASEEPIDLANVQFGGDTVSLYNPGVDIAREVLLLGVGGSVVSSKTNDDTIGAFREGLKLGTLALLRCGKEVKIGGRSETWTARLEEHDTFPGRRVIVFHTRENRIPKDGVTVSVSGVTREEWEQARSLFLIFARPRQIVETGRYGHGSILKDPGLKGRLYVKGVLVETRESLTYGYDIRRGITVDRDRKMVSSFDASYAIANTLKDAAENPESGIDLFAILENGEPWETESLRYVSGIGEDLAMRFLEKYGDDAYPGGNMEEASDVAHFGIRGIPVPKTLGSLLIGAGLDPLSAKQKACESPLRTWSLQDLTVPERAALQFGILTIAKALDAKDGDLLARIKIVDFRQETLDGLYQRGDISVARRLLADRFEFLACLVHEFAHDMGSDGEKNHVEAIESLWTKIARNMAR